ncbi:MAG: hypothetical protein F6K03_16490, partial [Kamptonema sp. SIO4C4]|nr:hypothetical protein [Kamptonema sp. SIO4C4]
RKWIQDTFKIERPEIARLCDRISSLQTNTSPQKTLESRLFLLIQQEGTSDRYGIKAAFIQDIHRYTPQHPIGYEPLEFNIDPFSLEQLTTPPPELLGELIDRLIEMRLGELQIEVFLPFNLLDQAVDGWQCESDYDEPFPIGQDYPLVIRIWDRLGYKKPYRKVIEWRKKWQEDRFQQSCQELLVCGDRTREEICEDLELKEAMGWRKTQPPQVGKGGEFSIVMREGIPIALWTRENLENCCNTEKYQDLLETPLQDLPKTLKRIRNSTPPDQTHLGHHLALLWDNPHHIPPDAPLFSNDNC